MEFKIRAILFAGASVLGFSSLVEGQTKPSTEQPSAAAGPNASAATTPELETLQEITVTGSRLIRNGLDSPTPLTSVSVDDLASVHPGTLGNQ